MQRGACILLGNPLKPHPRPQADAPDDERTHREDRSVQRREDRRGVGAAAPYPLQMRRGH